MTEFEYHKYSEKKIDGALAIVSFPTVGLVSTIVANFLIENLELELIGSFSSDDLYPAAIIHDGRPTPPVRVFAGDTVCGTDNECEQIVVITSELPIRTQAFSPMANEIINWCKEHKCKTLATIEGINSDNPLLEDEGAKVYSIGSNAVAENQLKGIDTENLTSGIVSGLSGILLFKANLSDYPLLCLLSEAKADYPDSRSAASVLKVLDKMVPQIKMDPQPLLEQAEKIEKNVKKAMAQMKPAPASEIPEIPPGMYH